MISFDGNMLTLPDADAGRPYRVEYRLQTAQRPKNIDWSPTFQGQVWHCRGIYSIQGDTLTICASIDGERPTKFEANGPDEICLVVFRKVRE